MRPMMWTAPILLALSGCVTTGDGSLGLGTYTYVDVMRPHGHARGEAAEQAATTACDRGDSQRIGTPKFDACMRSRGWRFAGFEPDSSPSYDSSDVSDASPPSGPDPNANMASDMAASQAANDAAQAMTNAASEAATQTEVQFNTIYSVNPN